MRVALFISCLADHFSPAAGEAVARLLRRHGVRVEFPPGQTCCGQAFWSSGCRPEALALAEHFLDTFDGYDHVVTPSGSCAAMVRYSYPELFRDHPRQAEAQALAGRVFEFSQYCVEVLGVTDVGARMQARATFHTSCHMARELGVTEPPLRMLRAVAGLELVEMERTDLCCGFGGSFAVRMPEISAAMANEKLALVAATRAELLVSCDTGCLMHLGGRARRLGLPLRPVHLAELLWAGVAGQ